MATGVIKPWKWPKIITEPGPAMEAALRKLLKAKRVGLDVENFGEIEKSTVMALGVASEKLAVSMPCHGYYAKGREWVKPIEEWPRGKQCLKLYKQIVESKTIKKVYQNGQHDILTFESLGWHPRGYQFDTLLAHAVVAPAMRHKLSLIACIEFHADRWKDEFAAGTDAKGAEAFVRRRSVDLRVYNAKDCIITVMLAKPLETRLNNFYNGPAIMAGYMERAKIAIEMRRTGVQVDTSKFGHHKEVLRGRMASSKADLRYIARRFGCHKPYRNRRANEYSDRYRDRRRVYNRTSGKIFNPNSKRHTDKLFFDKLGVPVKKYTKKGAPSLDQKYLTNLVVHPNVLIQAAARALLRYRRYAKLLKTYILGLTMDKDNIVHPTWNVHGAKTFRWSSQDPNVMNLPKPKIKVLLNGKKKVIAPGLRDIFMAHRGGWIVAGDYSQLELRILALLSGDKKLLAWYAQGIDVHQQNAKELFGVENPSKQQRDLAKRFVYGCNYGGDARTIWQALVVDFPSLSLLAVERLIQRWYALHPAIVDWQQLVLRQARLNKYIEAPLSRHRLYFIGPPEATKVFNYPIQHTAADIINAALMRVRAAIKWEEMPLLFQVHDELVLNADADWPSLLKAARILWKKMPQKVTLNGHTMDMTVDVKIGRDYGNCTEVADEKALKIEWQKSESLPSKQPRRTTRKRVKGKKKIIIKRRASAKSA